jgi:hypothetical protein
MNVTEINDFYLLECEGMFYLYRLTQPGLMTDNIVVKELFEEYKKLLKKQEEIESKD